MLKADFRKLVLTHLTVIDGTEDPSADDAATMDLFIDGVRAELLENGVCWWGEDAIPTAVSVPLMLVVAAQAACSFGKAGRGHEAQEDGGRKRLNRLRSTEERPTTQVEYF
jgi:hypothetical protein